MPQFFLNRELRSARRSTPDREGYRAYARRIARARAAYVKSYPPLARE